MNFANVYRNLLSDCLNYGTSEHNKRTNSAILALPEGASFPLDLRDGILPTCGLRKTRPHIAAAELAWCLLGHNHADWLRKHTKVWDDFCDAQACPHCEGSGYKPAQEPIGAFLKNIEGVNQPCPNCAGSGKNYWLDQAYGWRWRYKFGIDQLMVGLERLRQDPSDRRVWISSWDPSEDILQNNQKTVPCPVGFTLSVIAGELNSALMIRSSDLFMGLPYDVMRHAMLMAAAAASLKVKPGRMRVALAHPHLYEKQWLHVKQMLDEPDVSPRMGLHTWAIADIEREPDKYVAAIKAYANGYVWPIFDPKSEVVR